MLSFKKLTLTLVSALAFSLFLSVPQEIVFAQEVESGEKSPSLAPEKRLPLSKLSQESQDFELSLRSILYLLEQGFYYELSSEKKAALFDRIREAMNEELAAIDPYTVIFSEEETRGFNEYLRGEFAGIGAVISVHPDDNLQEKARRKEFLKRIAEKYGEKDPEKLSKLANADEQQEAERFEKAMGVIGEHGVLVVNPLPGSPAEKAGLREGWTIHTVNGAVVSKLSVEEAKDLIRGEPGTEVVLGVIPSEKDKESVVSLPRNTNGLLEIIATRAIVEIPQITSQTIEVKKPDGATQKIGYLRIARFVGNSVAQFEEHLLKLPRDMLIIDIRGNGGGTTMHAYGILDRLMPEGLLMYSMKVRGGEAVPQADSNGDSPQLFSGKLVVLTDGDSASASEILVGVLRDYKLATLIGEKTYGKGSAQKEFHLVDKTTLKMTIELFFLPNGETPNGVGIEPDIQAKDDPTTPVDETLATAIDFLMAK